MYSDLHFLLRPLVITVILPQNMIQELASLLSPWLDTRTCIHEHLTHRIEIRIEYRLRDIFACCWDFYITRSSFMRRIQICYPKIFLNNFKFTKKWQLYLHFLTTGLLPTFIFISIICTSNFMIQKKSMKFSKSIFKPTYIQHFVTITISL